MKTIRDVLKSAGREDGYGSPEWKHFAREIRKQRGNFCRCCKRGDVPTQVHHLFYELGQKLWEANPDEVVILCIPCHKALHRELQIFRKHAFGNFTPQSFHVLNGALAVAVQQYDPLVFAYALAEFVASPGMIQRFADAWGCTAAKTQPFAALPQGERAKAILAQAGIET